jgi:hypothetical protein
MSPSEPPEAHPCVDPNLRRTGMEIQNKFRRDRLKSMDPKLFCYKASGDTSRKNNNNDNY